MVSYVGYMPRYVAILEHSPDNCPTSNKAVRSAVEKLPSQLPAAMQKHNVKMLSDNVLGPTHKVVLILEAPNIEAVRNFIQDTGLVQWNETTVAPAVTIEETMKSIGMRLPTLF
jgi:hypothetical protein